MRRRTDRIWRDEQHTQPRRVSFERVEAVSEVAPQWPSKRFRIVDHGQRTRSPARPQRARKAAKRAPQSGEIGAAGLIAEYHAEQRAGVREEEVSHQPIPGMNILPAKQDEIL